MVLGDRAMPLVIGQSIKFKEDLFLTISGKAKC